MCVSVIESICISVANNTVRRVVKLTRHADSIPSSVMRVGFVT